MMPSSTQTSLTSFPEGENEVNEAVLICTQLIATEVLLRFLMSENKVHTAVTAKGSNATRNAPPYLMICA